MKTAFSLATLLILASFPTLARAEFMFQTLGAPEEGNSWTQAFEITTSRDFSNVGVVLHSFEGDSGFEAPAWLFDNVDNQPVGNPSGFTSGAITQLGPNTQMAVASGERTRTLLWESHFLDERTEQKFLLTLFAWDPWRNYQVAKAFWDGEDYSWSFGHSSRGITWDEFVAAGGVEAAGAISATPEPSSALLMLSGLAVAGVTFRRKRSRLV